VGRRDGVGFVAKRNSFARAVNRRVILLSLAIHISVLPTALGPGDYSASNRNEYENHKNNNVSGE
jgi:hypothetical protein